MNGDRMNEAPMRIGGTDFVEVCKGVIAIDSSVHQSNRQVVDYLAGHAANAGLQVEIQEESWAGASFANLLVRPQGHKSPVNQRELMLQTHLDTADPGPFGLWERNQSNPFSPQLLDGKIYGLGAADAKLDFVCKLSALASFTSASFRQRGCVVVGTFGEESGMAGALRLIRRNRISADWVCVGEPTGLRLFNRGKGIAAVEVTLPFSEEELAYRRDHDLSESTSTQSRIFKGRSVHSSEANRGESAIAKMFEYLEQMPRNLLVMEMDGGVSFNTVAASAFLELDVVSDIATTMGDRLVKLNHLLADLSSRMRLHSDPHFDPPHATLNVGCIRTLEDRILLSGTCRIPPGVNQDVYESWMKELKERVLALGGEMRIVDYKRPFATSETSPFVEICQGELRAMKLTDQLGSHASTNEASLFARTGMQCLSFGPGRREGSDSSTSEYVELRELEVATEFYRRLIGKACL